MTHLDTLRVVGKMGTSSPEVIDLRVDLVHGELSPQVRSLLVPEASANSKQTRDKQGTRTRDERLLLQKLATDLNPFLGASSYYDTNNISLASLSY